MNIQEQQGLRIGARIVDTTTKKLIFYRLENRDGATELIDYRDIGKYAPQITNAYIDLKTNTCRAKKGMRIPTLTKRELNQSFVVKDSFNREVYAEFDKWRLDKIHHDVLYVKGARQTGKTFAIKQYCYTHFDNVCYINLATDDTELVTTFKKWLLNKDCHTTAYALLTGLRSITGYFPDTSDSVLIIDEIQKDIGIFNAIRILKEHNFRTIVTGSYIGALSAYNNAKSVFWPAGSVYTVNMYPMSLHEVMQAMPTIPKRKVYDLYRQYGGYPEVVKEYCKGHYEAGKIGGILQRLWDTFYNECAYYMTPKEHKIIPTVIRNLVITLLREKRGSQIKDYSEIYKTLKREYPAVTISKDMIEFAILWLRDCGVILECPLYPEGNIRGMTTCMRYYVNDCGLLRSIAQKTGFDTTAIEGLVTENYVFAEFVKKRKFFELGCGTYNQYELDFLVLDTSKNIVYGFEVKTKDGDAPSLKEFKRKGLIDRAYKICAVAGEQNILLWELYKFNIE